MSCLTSSRMSCCSLRLLPPATTRQPPGVSWPIVSGRDIPAYSSSSLEREMAEANGDGEHNELRKTTI